MAGTLMMVIVLWTEFMKLTPIFVTLLFFAFSVYEAVSFHERIGHFLANHISITFNDGRKDAFLWPILFGVPALAGVGLAFRWLPQEGFMPAALWRNFFSVIDVLFAGAVGLEIMAFKPLGTSP